MLTSAPVVIVDDHQVFRAGLKSIIDAQPDLRVVAEAATGKGALAAIEQHKPKLVLLDLQLGEGSGLDVLRSLHTHDSQVRVLVLSAYSEAQYGLNVLQAGAAGVQMATRFVCTVECDVAKEFKQDYLEAKEEDIVIIKSPVGLPGRAIRNRFLKNLETGLREKIDCPYRCLSTCNVAEAHYCIAKALVNAYQGNMEKGLVFCGQNAHRLQKIVTVKELFTELLAEIEAY